MKKILLFMAYAFAGMLLVAYISFLFVLPKAIDLNTYLPEIQKLAKEQANLDVKISTPEVSTSPLLQAGIKTGNITVNLPDGSEIFSTEGITARISLPNLLLLNLKLAELDIISPKVNIEIENGEQFKVVRLVEDILNNKKENPPIEEDEVKEPPKILSYIKIKVPNAKLTNYSVVINDEKSKHNLKLKGDLLKLGYNNGKFAKIRTNASIFSDNDENITANINVDTFLPEQTKTIKENDDDPAEKVELPFINPVLVYRDYNLQSNLDTKLKIRQDKNGKPNIKGHFVVDNITMKLSGLQLPKSFIKTRFFGTMAEVDTDLVVKKDQEIKLNGNVDFGNKPSLDLNINTDKIFFNDMIILSKALLDTLHVKNNLASIHAKGYWIGRSNIKSDFKKLKSNGSIIARDGKILNGDANLVFDKLNVNLIFEDNNLEITDTHVYINGNILKVEGNIAPDSFADISVQSENLPLKGLFIAFAPNEVKKSINLSSGDLSLDAKLYGELKKSVTYANILLNNLSINDTKNTFKLNNEKLIAGIVTDLKTIDGNIANKNFSFNLTGTNSSIKNPSLVVKLNEKDIKILPFDVFVNNASKINIKGDLAEYSTDPKLNISANGLLNANDLKKFAGPSADPFVDAVGNLPIKAQITGNKKKKFVAIQVKSDSNNYITPLEIQSTLGKQTILQAKFDVSKDKFHIKDTGLYTGAISFTDDFNNNLSKTETVAEVNGTLVHLNTPHPLINLIRVKIPRDINAKITAFKNSTLKINGDLIVFGRVASPIMRGNFKIFDLRIPEILTNLEQANINLLGKNITLDVRSLLLNGSDINLQARTDINPHDKFTISRLNVTSRAIDLDRLLKVPENLNNYLPKSTGTTSSEPAGIPVLIENGRINLRQIKTGNIELTNTTGRISLRDNIFRLNSLSTRAFDGGISGDILVNLLNSALDIKVEGAGLNVAKTLLAVANMKDMLSGDLAFKTDIALSGSTMEEQIKSLKGNVTFMMTDGQLGPFGKLENMILAENIRESQFFQTALGGVINNLTTIDTTHFSTLAGVLDFKDGIVYIDPITSVGNVLSMHISGEYDLLKNTTDMKVRAKLGSVIASMLGPISQLNPVNLVQVTPGLNVVMAQAFTLFCEQLTPEESSALPHLATDLDDKMATKFQIVLRGDVAKPFSLVKSFKWLALASEIEKAEGFVSTLPDPSLVSDPENATIEAIMQAQEEKAIEDAKLKNKIIRFLKKEKI